MARVLVAYSRCQLTRSALAAHGHEVFTCDLLPFDSRWHLQCDAWTAIESQSWDLVIAHPMCTYLTTAGAWAFSDGPYHQRVRPGTLVGAARRQAREEALDNFRRLLSLPCVAVENPGRSFVSKAIRPPDQLIHPYQFGDDASKITGLWLNGLPHLRLGIRRQGRVVCYRGRYVERWANQTDSGQNALPPRVDRWLERSATYPGIASAFGQWGAFLASGPCPSSVSQGADRKPQPPTRFIVGGPGEDQRACPTLDHTPNR